jgi:carbamoyltransferase
MYILGINAAYHESAACLLNDGKVIAAVEEERFSRQKHGKPAMIDNPHELPLKAIEYCLAEGGITLADVAWIGYSMNPERRLQNGTFADRVVEGDWGSASGEELFYNQLLTVPEQLLAMGFKGEFKWVDHHLAHAASAFYPSAFTDAAVLAVDGIGETSSTLMAIGEGNLLRTVQEVPYPASIGFIWEKLAKYIGFSEYDACKVMGLSAYGDPTRYEGEFNQIITLQPDGTFTADNDVFCFRVEDYTALESLFGFKRRERGEPLTQEHSDLTAALQKVTERILLHMAEYLHRVSRSENLCMAGGVALNCVANGLLAEQGPFRHVYVQPAAHDAGTAMGAALVIHHMVLGNVERDALPHTYLGPSFTDQEIEAELRQAGVRYERVELIERAVAELLSQNRVVGWFQGRMEFGPRALGNRSLLADPRDPDNRERLNIVVKHREDFRPFAPSILHEEASHWYEITRPVLASDFMLVGYRVHKDRWEKIPAVVHVDGTSRIQTVRQETNLRYHRLISEFFALTGVPVLLNTSFNDNEPIVCTPADAVRTFKKTAIDYLAIGNFLIHR